MSDQNRLVVRIVTSILLVVVFYFLFSFIAAAIINHEMYVFELRDLAIPLVLGFIVEYNDIRKLVQGRKGE